MYIRKWQQFIHQKWQFWGLECIYLKMATIDKAILRIRSKKWSYNCEHTPLDWNFGSRNHLSEQPQTTSLVLRTEQWNSLCCGRCQLLWLTLQNLYCLIQRATFYSASDRLQEIGIMLCSCDQSLSQRERLLATDLCMWQEIAIFCPHGICYGFEVMATHESLRHPFQIFRSRFTVAPKLIIIYDNACKLHQYCLDREPAFFGHTQFAVDRFHWHSHIGCSLGWE